MKSTTKPPVVVVKSVELYRVARLIDKWLRENGIHASIGLNAALLLFAAGLKDNGHGEQDGHDALDRCYRLLDTEKPS
jgi:hypothetical protein